MQEMQETWVHSLSQEDPLEKEMATHSIILESDRYISSVFSEWEGRPQGVDWGFPYGSAGKNPPAMQEMQVRSLGQEDPLEEGKADSNILPGESHGQRSLVGCSPQVCQELDTTEAT